MSEICHQLHAMVAALPLVPNDLAGATIPSNGIYFVFERSEFAHAQNRIVRVGINSADGNLKSRLLDHLSKQKKDSSSFRKHIGRSILARRSDPYLEAWNKKMNRRSDREKFGHLFKPNVQASVEDEVSAHIAKNMTVCVLELHGKQIRADIEQKLLSTLAQCSICRAFEGWLGRYHPNQTIRNGGLWNIQGLKGRPISRSKLSEIFGSQPSKMQAP